MFEFVNVVHRGIFKAQLNFEIVGDGSALLVVQLNWSIVEDLNCQPAFYHTPHQHVNYLILVDHLEDLSKIGEDGLNVDGIKGLQTRGIKMNVQEGKVEVVLQMTVDFVGFDEEIILEGSIRNQFFDFIPAIEIACQDFLKGLLRHWLREIVLFVDLLLESFFSIEEGSIQHFRHHGFKIKSLI